ncbi:hypothetical protein HY637_03080 [Candidatus Woesearchaeota archaeon]|nr:hypothetical protein [Candidatus Woesearchaeota archaeon]
MFWSKKQNAERPEKKFVQINELLKLSFGNVKRDTINIFKWLNYLYRKNMEQEQLIRQMQLELSYVPKTREEIRRIIDDYYSFEGMMSKMRELAAKVEELAKFQQQRPEAPQPQSLVVSQKDYPRHLQNELGILQERLEKLEQKKLSMRERIAKRITRNSKEYVKSVIISYIRKYERISAFQLKEIVVEEQSLCSKSSFYRLLEEIEHLDEVGVIKQGKEKHYLLKSMGKIH